MRARTLVTVWSLAVATAVAGCFELPQEAERAEEPPADDGQSGLRWESNFSVPEDAERVFVNVTVERWGSGDAPVRVVAEGPTGDVVAERSDALEGDRARVIVEWAFGDVDEPTTDAVVEPGAWSLMVFTNGTVRVSGDAVALNGNETGNRQAF